MSAIEIAVKLLLSPDTVFRGFVDEHGAGIAIYIMIALIMQFICFLLAPSTAKDRVGLSNSMFWFLASPALCYHAFPATLALGHSAETRWIGVCEHSTSFQRAYIALQIVATVMEFLKTGSLSSKLPMIAHHILSCLGMSGGLGTGRLHFFACFDGCCEFTTIFVSFLQMSRMEGSGIDRWTLQKGLGKLSFQLNGVLLWLSFVLFRLVLFSVWLGLFAWDLLQPEFPSLIWEKLTRIELTFYPFITLFLLGLSAQWFAKIHKGSLIYADTPTPVAAACLTLVSQA